MDFNGTDVMTLIIDGDSEEENTLMNYIEDSFKKKKIKKSKHFIDKEANDIKLEIDLSEDLLEFVKVIPDVDSILDGERLKIITYIMSGISFSKKVNLLFIRDNDFEINTVYIEFDGYAVELVNENLDKRIYNICKDKLN